MLQIQKLTYQIGERYLLDHVNWTINPGRRTALVGPNGAGKTTLLRLLVNELRPRDGQIIKPKMYRIGYLPQEEIAVGRGRMLDVVMSGRTDLLALEHQIETLRRRIDEQPEQAEAIVNQLSRLEEQYALGDGYQLESLAKSILAGLGFQAAEMERPLHEFSGGWRMRVYLARLLIGNPDLLLLDEPTNHLDLPSLEWLEQYLLNFPGSIVIVSHDRFFIDRLAQDIYELDRGRLHYYAGNYHFYETEREKREALLKKQWEEQQAERARQERFIERFRYKATKAAQVQSRIRMLEKMETIDVPPAPQQFSFSLRVEEQSYKDVLTIHNLSFRYDEPWVLKHIHLKLYRGEKIALVGMNGAGKTTLTRLIAGELKPQQGALTIGRRVKIGYYAQHQVDALNLKATVYDEVAGYVASSYIPKIRDVLGTFQFRGDDVFKQIAVLSGGEKARVSLVRVILSPVNFLMMDEPTNHLDIASRKALEHALAGYDGTLLLISHDRYFLDKLVTRVVELRDGQLFEYEGNYSDYLRRRQETPNVSAAPGLKSTKTAPPGRKTKEQKRQEAKARQAVARERNQLKQEIAKCEQRIEQMEARKANIEAMLATPSTYQDGEQVGNLQREYCQLKSDIDAAIERWEAAQLELDALLASLGNG